MTGADAKADLHRYLQAAREALLWKLDGLAEYDIRRPLTPTGTNLLGLVKHLAGVELWYFGDAFGRPPRERPWSADDARNNADFWATADESRDQIVGMYRRAWAHADQTIEALGLDAAGHVPWWPAGAQEVTLHQILVHVVAETSRHAGQADIVRELIDGAAGMQADDDNLRTHDPKWWQNYHDQLERVAEEARQVGIDDVARLAEDLEGVRRTARDGLAEWRYHGRLVARQLDDVHLVIRADFGYRDSMLRQFPETFSVPARYVKHMMVVADLAGGDAGAIEDALEAAWQLQRSAD